MCDAQRPSAGWQAVRDVHGRQTVRLDLEFNLFEVPAKSVMRASHGFQ
jgi:hypothetical protein